MKLTTMTGMIVALAAVVQSSACFCNADEEHSISGGSVDSLTITRDGVSQRLQLSTHVHEAELPAERFRPVYLALERESIADEGIVLTLSSWGTEEQVHLVLAVPAGLRNGTTYAVGGIIGADPRLSTEPGTWGGVDLQDPNRAEVGFVASTYTFPPPAHTINYRATAATGSVRISDRGDGWVEMMLDLRFTDATGRVATVVGKVQVQAEEFTPPCT